MKTRLGRWGKRVLFALAVALGLFFALACIAATVFSNMDRSYVGSICVVIVYGCGSYLWWVWRNLFAKTSASPSAETADEDAGNAGADNEPEPDVVVMGTMHDDVSIISSDALASLTRGQNKVAHL